LICSCANSQKEIAKKVDREIAEKVNKEMFDKMLKGIILSNNQIIKYNNDLIKSINEIGIKISYSLMNPQSKKTASYNYPVFLEIKKKSNKIDDYFQSMLNILINEVDGEENWFTKNTYSQVLSYSPLREIKNLGDFDASTKLFSSDTTESNERGKLLVNKLLKYRDDLILTISDTCWDYKRKIHIITKKELKTVESFKKFLEDDKHPYKLQLLDIYLTLTKPDKFQQGKDIIYWNDIMFKEIPLVSAIGTFISLRNDIRISQNIASKILLGRIDKPQIISMKNEDEVDDEQK
jgi:hypothetical protein